MMKAEDFKGRPVVSVAEGARVGVVEDVLFNATALTIEILSVRGMAESRLLHFRDVQSVGPDAITVPTQDVVRAISDPNDPATALLLTLHELSQRKIVDENGTMLGGVDSVSIDPADGHIVSITAGQGGIIGIGRSTATIAVADVVSVGDVIVVRSTSADAASPTT